MADHDLATAFYAELVAHASDVVALVDSHAIMMEQRNFLGDHAGAVRIALETVAKLGSPVDVDALVPEILELTARLADQFNDPRRDPTAPVSRVARHEPLQRVLPPTHPPAPNRTNANPESAPAAVGP